MQAATEFYKEIYNSMLISTKKVISTKELLTDLEKVFLEFSRGLQGFTDRFNKEIMKQAEGENQKLLKSFQMFSNSLLKVSDTFKKLSISTKNAVIEPFSMFIQNYRETNRSLSKKVHGMITQLENKKELIKSLKVNSYQSWIKSEKSRSEIQKAIEKIERGGKNTDLIKANDNSLKLRLGAEDLEKLYKQQVQNYNKLWKETVKQLQNFCVLYQYNEESRLSFSRITFSTALKLLDEAGLIESGIETKIKQSQQLLKGLTQKPPLFETMSSKSKFKLLFDGEDDESFLSYQESRREKDTKKQHDPYRMITPKERDQIQELLNIWLNGKELIKVPKQLEKIRMLIISTSVYSFYFVDVFYNKIQRLPQYYCKLEEEHFNELLNVLTLISRILENGNTKSYEQLYKVINISMRIMKKKKEKTCSPRQLLSSALGKASKIFTNEQVWLNLLKHIKTKSHKKKPQGSIVKGIGIAFLRGIGDLVNGKKEDEEEDNQFQSIQELTTLIANLSVPTEFSLPMIKSLLEGRQQAFELLKDVMYTKEDTQLRQKLLDPKQITQNKLNKQLQIIHNKMLPQWTLKQVAKSGFLDQSGVNLRLVCQYLRTSHKYVIHKLDIPRKWLHILGCPVRDYVHMKLEVAQQSVPSSVEQIITLDVNRSLHMHSEYLSPTMLHTLLRTFAYFNKTISYCQGMNYIAGYLFIKIRDEVETYSVFERIMQTHFNELFINEFEILKIKMYQFQRLLNIFLPELSEHFKRQLISSECYIVSWMITLYAATYQYTINSYVVDFLWDRFVVWGWREFFKFTLWIFWLYKDQLLELTFDKALHFLGDLTKSELFSSNKQKLASHPKIQLDKMVDQIDSFHITNKLLNQLKKDYGVSRKVSKH